MSHTYHKAKQRILQPENRNAGIIIPRAIILHTVVDAVGHTDLAAYEDREDVGSRVHFYIHRSGQIDQLLDCNRRGVASGIADEWAWSVETEDDSASRGSDVLPLTEAQLKSFIELCEWGFSNYSTIPRRKSTASKGSGAYGIGYHSQPMRERWEYKQSNGIWRNSWTSFQGKICPGDKKVEQYNNVIMPTLLGNVNVPEPIVPVPPVGDDDMGLAQWDVASKLELAALLHNGVVKRVTGSVNSGINDPVTNLGDIYNEIQKVLAAIAGIKTGVADPQVIGEAIIAEIGDDLAKKVADVLYGRLED